MAEHSHRFIVLTGGPGSGKTTLVAALRMAGFGQSAEAGRSIIQDQVLIGGAALPWKDPCAYAELMLSWEMRSYREAQALPGLVFFDRGIPDIIGYLRLIGRSVPEHLSRAAAIFRYNRRVFIAPPWPEIFSQDEERKQSLVEAEETYRSMITTYAACGYELVEIPRLPVEERVSFVVEKVASLSPSGP
ncbi:AAA family ATPase [Microvirga rosea]|uniref:AAA family ATPase n=1 Tax=Microvirga rosea TaxID=2715425 RepID=UPI001D0A5E85|nr:AAA family ATPase [Microvirga rosea]MCB8820001.1 AAA family ATPase [Microvirga rosea]